MVDKGILGDVKHIHAQWHRNMINKPSSLWTMKPGGENEHRQLARVPAMSGGLTAELTSHQVDVADWMFGSSPEFVMGFGSLDTLKDGRDVYDNIQLIYRYPKRPEVDVVRRSARTSIPALLQRAARPRWARSSWAPTARSRSRWARTIHHRRSRGGIASLPRIREGAKAGEKKEAVRGRRDDGGSGGANGPIPLMFDDLNITGKESFLDREVKFARRWLTAKGVMVQEEQRNPGGHGTGELLPELPRRADAAGRPRSRAWRTRSR